MRTLLLLTLLGGLASCAPDYEDAPVKLAGVGYNPDEIGPSPTPYGGVVEYSWVNFAGGGLSLSLMGLSGYDEVGPSFAGFAPPYSAVFGFSYLFDHRLAAADTLAGVTSVPPEVEDACYTSFDASGPIGSFKTVDVGSYMEFRTTDEDRSGGMRLDRIPAEFPPNPQDAFVYYIAVDYWSPETLYGLLPSDGRNADDPGSMTPTVIRTANFPFGQEVEYRFPGGLQEAEVPVGSLPRPSSAVDGGNTRYSLPAAPGGVIVEWNGPRFDRYGLPEADGASGPVSTCLAYLDPAEAPTDPADCAETASMAISDAVGQVYTGPWDTSDGKVRFRWNPGTDDVVDDFVSISVRFLGPVDTTDPFFKENVVQVEPDADAQRAWREAGAPPGADIPMGRRTPQPCETDADGNPVGEWVFDDAYETYDGELAPAMRGNPSHNLAELVCRLKDDGEYELTTAQLQEAMDYARAHGSQGAIFYFARSTEVEADVPPAKDQYDQKLDISPIKLTSRAVDIGRFWYEE